MPSMGPGPPGRPGRAGGSAASRGPAIMAPTAAPAIHIVIRMEASSSPVTLVLTH